MLQHVEPGQSLQRLARSGRFYTDNHGRKFFAMADNATQQPIEEMRPFGFTPPWTPPMRFAKFEKDGELHFRWDYQSMADELSADIAAYYEQATKFALEHNLPVPEVGGVVDRRISAVFGPAPLSPEIPLAAQAGDRWLLGDSNAPQVDELALILRQGTISSGNDALRMIKDRIAKRMGTTEEKAVDADDAILEADAPVTYQQFVAEGRKGGMSMADLAIAWKAHKDNSVVTV